MTAAKETVLSATRNWNWRIWAGLLTAIVAFLSYIAFFVRFPITRNVPWVNWLLFALAGWLSWDGLRRARGHPQTYRGKIAGWITAALTLSMAGFFAFATLIASRHLPPSAGAPRVGATAPQFDLSDSDGKMDGLPAMFSEPMPEKWGSGARPRAVALIFYRGYW
jgi:hypothetical protein